MFIYESKGIMNIGYWNRFWKNGLEWFGQILQACAEECDCAAVKGVLLDCAAVN
jgi:hypothetical protein